MDRRKFAIALTTAVSGMLTAHALGQAGAGDKQSKDSCNAADGAAKHVCKGHNECKGQGGCSSGDNGCAGKNSCKGKGGCATVAHHDCKGLNECKGQGGCSTGDNGCAAKNSCKGKGGCSVPLKAKNSLRLRRRRLHLA